MPVSLLMQEVPASLQDVMQYCKKKKHELPLLQRIDIALQIVDALKYLHTMCIAHHNLHPGNIMLTSSFDPVLTDVGMEAFEKDILHREYDNLYVDSIRIELEEFSPAYDVFSFGRLLLYVGTQKRN